MKLNKNEQNYLLTILFKSYILSACCFDEQKNETSNVNPKVQSVETVSVTRGNLTPTVSAHTTIIPA